MRLALVSTDRGPCPPVKGGAIQLTISRLAPLLARDHDVTVFSVTDPDLPDREVSKGVHFERFDSDGFVRRVGGRVRQGEFDVIQVYNRPSWVLPLRQAAPDAVIALSLHNLTHNMMNQRLAVRGFEAADHVLTISDFVARDAIAKLPQLAAKTQTIYTGVDLGEYALRWSDRGMEWRAEIRSRHELSANGSVVLFVGRLLEKKGCHILLRAMREVLAIHPDATLLVVGSEWYVGDSGSDYVAELKQLAEAYGRAVVFTSSVPVDDIPKYYAAADVFACASQWEEPLGRVHYEAMAAGLPIVTTRRGGIDEVVQDGENGIVIDRYQDPAAFSSAIATLLGDPARAAAMGRAGRRKAEDVYNFERMSSELQAAYARLLNTRGEGKRAEGSYRSGDEATPTLPRTRTTLASRSRLFVKRVHRRMARMMQSGARNRQ